MSLNLFSRLTNYSRRVFSPKRIAARLLAERLGSKPRYQAGRVRFGKYNWEYADAASFFSAYRQILVEDWYAYNHEIVNRFPLILDCGANIGLASLYFATQSPKARIIAFEPDSSFYGLLTENIASNQLTTNVDVVNAALWIGEAHFIPFCPDGADGGFINSAAPISVQVNVVRLRDYLSEPVGLLKMDIEGAELDVLSDSIELLGNVKQIILEHHSVVSEPQRLAALMDLLEKSGFRIHINNIHRWINPLVQNTVMGRFDQLLIIYGYRQDVQLQWQNP